MTRTGLISAVLMSLAAACARSATFTPASPASNADAPELTRDEQARHVLNRLAFGPRPGEVARVASMGVDKWIASQLSPTSVTDGEADRLLSSLETQRKQAFELLADHPAPQELTQLFATRRAAENGVVPPAPVISSPEDSALLKRAQQTVNQLNAQITAARTLRAVVSERQLLEVMTDFWENHFSVYIGKSPNRYSIVEYDRDVIRPRALGKFRDLLGAVAKSPQMLVYLDNYQSSVDSLHPNVVEARIEARRQLANADPVAQALSTLPRRRGRGVNENYARELMELHTLGVDGGYTQKDVQEVARALTGWTVDSPQFGGWFVFRPELHDAGEKVVLGHTLPAGRGIEDGEAVLDLLARAPPTAKFITTKLARHFVSDDPPPALVSRCASVFTKSDGDIAATMRCIVTSPEFFSRSAYRAKVKTPFELVTSIMRAFDAQPDTTQRTAQLVNQLGQPIYGKLTPDGWPERGDAWMNSGALLNRINLGFRVAAGQVPTVKLATWPATPRLTALPREAQVDGVIEELLGSVSSETRRILLTGENPIVTTPPKGPQLKGLPEIVGLALGSPEFQRR